MSAPSDPLALADWRRRTAELYARVRAAADPAAAHADWVATRDRMFATHACTPLDESHRRAFGGLAVAPYRPGWRCVGRVDPHVVREVAAVGVGQDGTLTLERVARVAFTSPAGEGALDLFWVRGYGGGLFLPFGDSTNGGTTFGGGRYLYDTVKGADPGSAPGELVLDFNFAYNPSCAYSARWVCPLAPPGNVLPFAVPVGEQAQEV